jgi:hypothetical protein
MIGPDAPPLLEASAIAIATTVGNQSDGAEQSDTIKISVPDKLA